MRPMTMTESYCLDTNILICLHKPVIDRNTQTALILVNQPFHSSTQILSEYINVIQRVFSIPKDKILAGCLRTFTQATIHPVTKDTLVHADFLRAKYQFQIFDAIIVASAMSANCSIFYSEDMQHNQFIEGKLRIVNPFL